MADEWSLPELVRAFIDFREETRDELKWLRRLIIGGFVTVIVASISTSAFVVVKGIG